MASNIQKIIEEEFGPDRDVKELVTRKVLLAKDLPVSYRQINHWNEKGLLIGKTKPGKWREFSFMEYVWVLMIVKLREWGVGLKEIHSVRNFMTSSIYHLVSFLLEQQNESIQEKKEKESKEFSELWDQYKNHPVEFALCFTGPEYYHLSYLLAQALELEVDILLKINPNKTPPVQWIRIGDKQAELQKLMNSFFVDGGGILISLKSIIHEMYNQDLFNWKKVLPGQPTPNIQRIIQVLEETNIKRVIIEKRKGEINHLKIEEAPVNVKVEDFKASLLNLGNWEGHYINRIENEYVIIRHRTEKL